MIVDKFQASLQIANIPGGNASNYFIRFLTNLVEAFNGTSGVVAAGVNQVTLGNTVNFSSGTGSPNGVVPGNLGDQYTNLAGGAGTTLYVKESGAAGSNTGWAAK